MMDLEKLKTQIEAVGVPAAYGGFAKKQATPYICYEITNTNNFMADGVVYYQIDQVEVTLHETRMDLALEKALENALSEYKWNKTVEYNGDEEIYVTTYGMEE